MLKIKKGKFCKKCNTHNSHFSIMKRQFTLLSAYFIFLSLTAQNPDSCIKNQSPADIAPIRLTCEHLINPPVVDALNPRLSWINKPIDPNTRGQKQTAWQICVASSRDKLLDEEADLWDSEKRLWQ